MPRHLLQPGTTLAVSLAEMAAQLNLSTDEAADFEPIITAYVQAAQVQAEKATGQALSVQTWEQYQDAFTPEIILRPPPLIEIQEITYLDIEETPQTLAPTQYRVLPGLISRLIPARGAGWPATCTDPQAVTIRYTAGYGTPQNPVPQPIKQWIAIQAATWFSNREATASGMMHPLPRNHVDALLDPYRLNLAL